MARKKFLTLVTAGLVVAGGFGGVAAQAVSMNSVADVADDTAAPTVPDETTTPAVDDAYIDEFFLQGKWQEFRQVGQLTMESCMAEGGFPFDGTTFDGMPSGLSEVDQEAWYAAAEPCWAERDAATAAAEAAYVPTEEERAAALAFAGQYQGWIDEMRSCMADRGHEFVGDVDMTLQTAPFADAKLPAGMPDGLSPDDAHTWLLDATGYDSSYPRSEQSTWEASCGFVADAAAGFDH
ncbi:hypothetical protein SAMN06295909_0068 [Plantibacter sp. VKM Ac-1784]|uniref:Metalloprotease n=1 Tax=Plantibacter elymi (nom. nud.) TaxID=199708 RepID=A0ABY1R701_9MICO|nr:hypothetical protein [Plantibacter sp. VKM Ac-1784]SMQ57903.1 hypothetical protein SAMN06295909_0068 [Plantibacter sp. VKM Ac-1784]